MLTELALTPHTLQACTLQPNEWEAQLRALNQRLVHYGHQCPLIFSNLNVNSVHHTAAWRSEVGRLLAGARGRHVRLLQDLFQLLERYIVIRPSFGQVRVVADEQHWVREAIGPESTHPIDAIIVGYAGLSQSHRTCSRAICVNRLNQEPFWDGIAFSAFPPMNIAAQVEVLRPLWLHGQVLAVVLPYALDTSVTGEANWFFQFASRAYSRPTGHGEPLIELHVSYDGNGADVIAQGPTHPVIANFTREAQRQAGLRGHEFALYVRARSHGSQRFIARRLFGGEQANVGTGTPAVRIRWGVALEHVAHPNDAPNQTPATFTLLPRPQAESQFRFECENTGPRLAGPIIVRC